MAYQDDFTLPPEIMEQIAQQGIDYLSKLIWTLVNAAMEIERQKYLGASRFEHNLERIGHPNDYKPKTFKTRLGEVTFKVPQVREGGKMYLSFGAVPSPPTSPQLSARTLTNRWEK